jgi:hypothetical protein
MGGNNCFAASLKPPKQPVDTNLWTEHTRVETAGHMYAWQNIKQKLRARPLVLLVLPGQ